MNEPFPYKTLKTNIWKFDAIYVKWEKLLYSPVSFRINLTYIQI